MRASARKGEASDPVEKAKIAEADSLCSERTEQRNPFFAAEKHLTLPRSEKLRSLTFRRTRQLENPGSASETLMRHDCGNRQLPVTASLYLLLRGLLSWDGAAETLSKELSREISLIAAR